jgi:hypothetical protein
MNMEEFRSRGSDPKKAMTDEGRAERRNKVPKHDNTLKGKKEERPGDGQIEGEADFRTSSRSRGRDGKERAPRVSARVPTRAAKILTPSDKSFSECRHRGRTPLLPIESSAFLGGGLIAHIFLDGDYTGRARPPEAPFLHSPRLHLHPIFRNRLLVASIARATSNNARLLERLQFHSPTAFPFVRYYKIIRVQSSSGSANFTDQHRQLALRRAFQIQNVSDCV